ncbi:hypothetical protein J6590_069139 [Homalodisca vitripennis]|nr:hypothetical protein J6590_069139 [Homalodisca vitripennis]
MFLTQLLSCSRDTCDICNASGLQLVSRYSSSIDNPPSNLTQNNPQIVHQVTVNEVLEDVIAIRVNSTPFEATEIGQGTSRLRTTMDENFQNNSALDSTHVSSSTEANEIPHNSQHYQQETVGILATLSDDVHDDRAREENIYPDSRIRTTMNENFQNNSALDSTHVSSSTEANEIPHNSQHYQQETVSILATLSDDVHDDRALEENIYPDGTFIEPLIAVPVIVELHEDYAIDENTTYDSPMIEQGTVSVQAPMIEDVQNYIVEEISLGSPQLVVLELPDSNNNYQQGTRNQSAVVLAEGDIVPPSQPYVRVFYDLGNTRGPMGMEALSSDSDVNYDPDALTDSRATEIDGLQEENATEGNATYDRSPTEPSETTNTTNVSAWKMTMLSTKTLIMTELLEPIEKPNITKDSQLYQQRIVDVQTPVNKGLDDDSAIDEKINHDSAAIISFEAPNSSISATMSHHHQSDTILIPRVSDGTVRHFSDDAIVNETLHDGSAIEEMIIDDGSPTNITELTDINNVLCPTYEDGNKSSLKRGLEIVSEPVEKCFKTRKLE